MSIHLSERAAFLVDNLDLEAATGVDGARWEHFQLSHLNDDSIFRIESKSRQIAWSWTAAAEAVAEAVLYAAPSIFVSINLNEAVEKIRYARAIYESLEVGNLPRITRDNQLGLEFANGGRLESLPSKAPRGKARFNVYLDEFAHVQRDRLIYTGALPVISKGGRIRIGSSPFGASGQFWEIFSESIQPYPGYTRKRTPWWDTYAFCTDVKTARRLAPAMLTQDRVERFGNDRIRILFANLPLEDFQQEYEAEFVDETTAWITWDEIRANQSESLLCAAGRMFGKERSKVSDAIETLKRWLADKAVETVFGLGYDVGRTRNTSELFLTGVSTTGTYPLRLMLTLDNVEFDDQKDVIEQVVTSFPVKKGYIDQNGIGRNLAENLAKKYPTKIEGVDFTNASKQLWATDSKMLFQQKKTPIPVNRDLAYQIHSIKKMITAAKNNVFDTGRNEKHHADKFWAHSLALAASLTAGRPDLTKIAPASMTSGSTWNIE